MLKYIKLNHRRGRLVASAANKLGTVSHTRHKPYTGVRRRKDHKRSPVDAARSLGRLDQKAADRSSRANIARSPLSTAIEMSESTFSTAVSVLWCARHADCRSGNSLRCDRSCLETIGSNTFDNTSRLEMGQYDLTSNLSRSGFFK